MPFGLDIIDLILAPLLLFGLPAAMIFFAFRLVSRALGRSSRATGDVQLTTELRQAQLRIEELETKVEQVEEKTAFTHDLLERPRQ